MANKKKIIINSTLAGIIATSGVIGATAALTSCNVSISAGSGIPEQGPQAPTKNPGFSNFIENIEKNDIEQLDEVAKKPIIPPKVELNPQGTGDNVKATKSYVMGTKEFKDTVNEQKERLFELSQQLVVEKINSIFGDEIEEFDRIANVKKVGSKYTVSYQLSKKPLVDDTLEPDENPELPEDNNQETQTRTINKLQPFFAFKYFFDFSNIKFDINNDAYLVMQGAETTGEFDMNGKIQDLPPDVCIDLNNKQDLFNKQFNNVYFGDNIFSSVENWNRTKLTNNNFLNSIKTNAVNAIKQKAENLKWMIAKVYKIISLLKDNITFREFIFDLKPIIVDAMQRMKMHPALVTTVSDILNPKVEYGSVLKPKEGTIRYDIKLLRKAGFFNFIIETGINTFIGSIDQSIHPIDHLLNLPTTLSKYDPATIDSKLAAIESKLKLNIRSKIKPYAKTIQKVFNLVTEIQSLAPNKKLGDIKILDFFVAKNMRNFWAKIIGPNGLAGINKFENDYRDFLNHINMDRQDISNAISAFINPEYWCTHGEQNLADLFQNHTSLKMVRENVTPNSDGQTFNIDIAYKLEIDNDANINLEFLERLLNRISVKQALTKLHVKIDKFLKWIIGIFTDDLYNYLPSYIHITHGDYIEFQIKDSNAFLTPTKNGYVIHAKQKYNVNFEQSINNTVNDLFQYVPKIARKKVKSLIMPKIQPMISTLKDYYFKLYSPTSIISVVEDKNNLMDLTDLVLDGDTIDNSIENINKIKANVLRNYVNSKISQFNTWKDFTQDIDHDIKVKILKELGLNPDRYLSKAKFILKMTPGFSMSASTSSAPKVSGITLDLALNVPVRQKGTDQWVNHITFSNIK